MSASPAPLRFFPEGTPDEGALWHLKSRVASHHAGDPPPVWRLDPGNLPLLSRALEELGARGAGALVVELPATDLSDEETEVAHEGELVPTLRRLVARAVRENGEVSPAGRDTRARPVLRLSTGRAYVLPPSTLDISTNDLCGLACVMCKNRNTRRDPGTMPPETVQRLIREAAAWGVARVALTGAGEPFRDPALPDHVELAHSVGLLSTVTTNGLPITGALARRLAASRVSISVSIHGATTGTHDALTGIRGSGEAAWRAVDRLVAAREEGGARGRFFVSVSTVLQRGNVHEIEALVARSRAAGCDGHNLQPVNLQHGRFDGRAVLREDDRVLIDELWPTAEQAPLLDSLFAALVSDRRRDGFLRSSEERLLLMRRYFADSSREALGVTCQVGESFLGVDHRGHLKPCYRLPWQVGDVRQVSFRRVWSSRRYAAVRGTVEECPLTCLNNCFFRKSPL